MTVAPQFTKLLYEVLHLIVDHSGRLSEITLRSLEQQFLRLATSAAHIIGTSVGFGNVFPVNLSGHCFHRSTSFYFFTRPPFISHYAIIQGEMGLFLTFSIFELQRGYLYQNGVEFRQKVIGAG